ncbi:hypothetical protein [Aurantiacibacter xanthus]|uniref:hypothetical protein n=1 Tax=Aurantiacibacter xanthus TaxID=1784712 RepID=UPI0011C21ED8|nr:hypothetical protein [Aurantiacibacter xanthus]
MMMRRCWRSGIHARPAGSLAIWPMRRCAGKAIRAEDLPATLREAFPDWAAAPDNFTLIHFSRVAMEEDATCKE